jgi:hypothetical protein
LLSGRRATYRGFESRPLRKDPSETYLPRLRRAARRDAVVEDGGPALHACITDACVDGLVDPLTRRGAVRFSTWSHPTDVAARASPTSLSFPSIALQTTRPASRLWTSAIKLYRLDLQSPPAILAE